MKFYIFKNFQGFFHVFFTKSICDKNHRNSGAKSVPETCNTAIEWKFYVDL